MKNGITEEEMERMKAQGVRFYDSPEEQEKAYLQDGLRRTPEERFRFLMLLMKEGVLMNKAVRLK